MKKERNVKKRNRLYFHLIALPLLILTLSAGAWAKDIRLQLEADDDPNIAGYRIYYRAGTPDGPFDGKGADQGASPIDIGLSLDSTVSGLRGQVFYFAVTAYDAWGDESEFSNIIASHWTPVVSFPDAAALVSPKAVDFAWEAPPAIDEVVYYKLAYTTDASALDGSAIALAYPGGALFAGMSVLALAGFGISSRRRMRFIAPLILASFILVASGCGDGSEHYDFAPIGTDLQWDLEKVEVLDDIVETSVTILNLEPSTTYYWQVVAVHADGVETKSLVNSFSTEAH